MGRRAVGHLHDGKAFRHRLDHAPHHRGIEQADTADAKTVRLGQLARIYDKSAGFYFIIEYVEIEVGIFGTEESRDDRRQPAIFKQGFKAESAHAADQDIAVFAITRQPAGNAALLGMLFKRFIKGDQHMGRRVKRHCPVLFICAH